MLYTGVSNFRRMARDLRPSAQKHVRKLQIKHRISNPRLYMPCHLDWVLPNVNVPEHQHPVLCHGRIHHAPFGVHGSSVLHANNSTCKSKISVSSRGVLYYYCITPNASSTTRSYAFSVSIVDHGTMLHGDTERETSALHVCTSDKHRKKR